MLRWRTDDTKVYSIGVLSEDPYGNERTLWAPQRPAMRAPRPWLVADDDPGDEYPPPLRALVLARTAPRRHESRVVCALWAALEASGAPLAEEIDRQGCYDTPRDLALVGAGRLLWAGGGVGGPRGFDGGATDRPDWAQGLGKGRANATDGPTWTSALVGAGCLLAWTYGSAEYDALVAAVEWLLEAVQAMNPSEYPTDDPPGVVKELHFAACALLRTLDEFARWPARDNRVERSWQYARLLRRVLDAAVQHGQERVAQLLERWDVDEVPVDAEGEE